jgi:tripartite-type tricarboxylate transporter receptor subunit TctC
MRTLAVIACWWLLSAAGLVNAAGADEFPVKSIRIAVPFSAGGTDLLGGHIPTMFDTPTPVLPEAAAGNIRVLAVASLTRAASLPDVPTMDQAGVKGFESIAWFGL